MRALEGAHYGEHDATRPVQRARWRSLALLDVPLRAPAWPAQSSRGEVSEGGRSPPPSPMIDPLFLLEAVVNGVLLGGVLALLSLGLNLIFGVIDIVWIAYVDLVMLCMYAVYFLVTVYRWPIVLAGVGSVVTGVILGLLVHLLIISPILSSPPINQFLATGGLLFFIQSFATLLWSTDHRSVRVNLPVLEVGGI